MEPILLFAILSVILIAVSLMAAYLPQTAKVSDLHSHMLVSVSTGIFLGLLMFMLIPEGLEECEEGGIDTHVAMYALVIGFVAILIVDAVMKSRHAITCGCEAEDHERAMMTNSTFIGLAIHAACDGLALAAMFAAGEEVGLMATVGFCIHKFAELFSLSSTMLVTDLDRKQCMFRLGVFSLITPIAGMAFFLLFSDMELEGVLGMPLLFAAGTLLFVTTCNMIPESFHKGNRIVSLGLILLGLALMLAVGLAFPHAH
jgi:zinc transporter ZupT